MADGFSVITSLASLVIFLFCFQVIVEKGVHSIVVISQEKSHFPVGGAGDVVGFIRFFGKVEVVFGCGR